MAPWPRSSVVPVLVTVALSFVVVACDQRTPEVSPERPSSGATAKPQTGKVELLAVPPGAEPLADVVKRERARADARGRDLLVYVGAGWCEPCERFHKAAAAGQLDAAFPRLTLLELDHDRDEARLAAAGYTSRLIPLFARPGVDGRASGDQIEGSIKGDGARDHPAAPRAGGEGSLVHRRRDGIKRIARCTRALAQRAWGVGRSPSERISRAPTGRVSGPIVAMVDVTSRAVH